MRYLLTHAYLNYKGLFLWLSWIGYLSNVFVRPVLMLTMFALLGRFALDPEAEQRYVIGMAVYSMSDIILGGISQTFNWDRAFGTLSVTFSTNASRLMVYANRCLLHLPNAALSFITCILFAWLILDLRLSEANWGPIAALIAAAILSATAFVLLLGNAVTLMRNWLIVAGFGNGLLLAMTGVIVPIESMPWILGDIARGLPLTNGLLGIRDAFAGGSLADIASNLGLELAVGAAYGALGFASFLWVEARGRRTGEFETASV